MIGTENGEPAGSRGETPASAGKVESGPAAPDDDRPTVQERVQEFRDLYPEKASTFVLHDSADDPRDPIKIRRDAAQHYRSEHEGDRVEGEFYPLTWDGVLESYLEWFEGVRNLRGKFTDGEETWTKRFLNSYHPEYLDTYYAQLMGLHREVEREYQDPQTALLSLTSSGTYEDGTQRGPVDHQQERRDAWGPTYKRLYDRMEALVDEGRIDDWMYVVIEEHHPGPFKQNSGYGHDHPVIIADGELRESDFYDVVDTWVENCPGAEHDAHDYRHPKPAKRPIKTRRLDSDDEANPDVMNSAAGYLVKYLGDPGEEFMEREIEQLAQQSIKWATNTRRLRKSDRAGEAIAADLCRQKAADDDRPQDFDHGDRLKRRESGRGPEVVCQGCGSGWAIDPDAETVAEARIAADAEEAESAAREPTTKERLATSWGDAPTVARADEDGVTAVERPPPARLDAYVVNGEEHPVTSTTGGVEMVPVTGWRDVPMGLEGSVGREEQRGRPPPGKSGGTG